MDFYLAVKFWRWMQARVCASRQVQPGGTYVRLSFIGFDKYPAICNGKHLCCGKFLRTFYLSCLRVVRIFDWLLRLCWVYIQGLDTWFLQYDCLVWVRELFLRSDLLSDGTLWRLFGECWHLRGSADAGCVCQCLSQAEPSYNRIFQQFGVGRCLR